MNISIRKLQKEDIDQVIKIEEMAYGEHHWSRDSFINELDNNLSCYFAAVDEINRLLGYIGSWFIFDEVHITTVAVHKNFQRQNIAHRLFLKLLEEAYKRMVKYLTLEVRVSNLPAISLYTAWGFKDVGVRKGYYQDNNEDALIMFSENIFHEKFKMIYNKYREKFAEEINNDEKN